MRRKRALLLNQFFWPDAAPTARLLEDVARELVRRGWDVTVICGKAAYVEQESGDAPPVNILRVPALPYSRNALNRMLSWLSFIGLAAVRSLFCGKFDLILTLTTPPGLSAVGWVQKVLRGSRFWIWEMDVYPDVAVTVGVMRRGSTIEKLMRSSMNALRRRADGIIALGDCMRTLLARQGLDASRIFVAENWTDLTLFTDLALRPTPPLNILYSGNMGLAHDIATISAVLVQLKDRTDIRFLFSGGGVRHEELRKFCTEHSIPNATFQKYVDRDQFGAMLAACHVGLVSLQSECAGTVVPSKLYSFLAAARPVLYIGSADTTPTQVLAQGCGWQRNPGDVAGVVALLQQLSANPNLLHDASVKARQIAKLRYDVPEGTARVADVLTGP